MSITLKEDELPILLEQSRDERKAKISILLKAIGFCLLTCLLGLGVFTLSKSKYKIEKRRFWIWLVLGLSIILGGFVSNLILKFILYLSKLNRFCRVRVLFFIIEEKNSLHRLFWSVIVFIMGYLIIYHLLQIKSKDRYSMELTMMLLFLIMIGCFVWLTMSVFLKLHTIKCLKEIHFDRVTKSILEQYVLRVLLSSPEHLNHEISKFKDLSQLNKKDVTARIMDKLVNMAGDGSLPSIEKLIHIDNHIEASVTKSILQNIIKLGYSSSHIENIKKFLSEQSALTINIFKGDEVNEKALHLWVETVYKNRQALVSDMKKTNTAITKQHLVVRISIGVMLIFCTFYNLKRKASQVGSAPPPKPVFMVASSP